MRLVHFCSVHILANSKKLTGLKYNNGYSRDQFYMQKSQEFNFRKITILAEE